MASISISDLYSLEPSLISLKETELGLLKAAVDRAVEARHIAGGATDLGNESGTISFPFPGSTIGIISYPPRPLPDLA